MGPDGHPTHLRPVPGPGQATAPELPASEGEVSGLTPPRSRLRSTGFVTDVLIELGFCPPETVGQAIEQARSAGRPPESILLEQGSVTADQLAKPAGRSGAPSVASNPIQLRTFGQASGASASKDAYSASAITQVASELSITYAISSALKR